MNWKVRFKHWGFWIGILGAIGTPVLAYFGMTSADLTTWNGLFYVIKGVAGNPFLMFMVISAVATFIGVTNDPTTAGLGDSSRAMGYNTPNKDETEAWR